MNNKYEMIDYLMNTDSYLVLQKDGSLKEIKISNKSKELNEKLLKDMKESRKRIYLNDFLSLCSKERIDNVDLEHINLIQERIKEFNEVDN